jgi:hypothetical protein
VTAPRESTEPEAPVVRRPVDQSDAERSTPAALFAGADADEFRGRWSQIQTSFVDEPRSAVQQADSLVAEVLQRLTKTFTDERSALERQWDTGDDNDTEALRLALRRYRAFFDRLLAM